MPSTVIVVGRKYQVNLQSSIQKNLGFLSHLSGPICGLQPPPTLPPNPNPVDEWGLARLIGYIGGGAAFWLFTRRRESRNAPQDHGFRLRVVLGAVRTPAYPGIPMDQDADTPDRAAQGEE